MKKLFVEVKTGGKMTYSVSDLNKLDRMYETEVFERKEKRVMSPFKKEMQKSFQAQVRDYAFEKILDRHLYTFKYLLVIPNRRHLFYSILQKSVKLCIELSVTLLTVTLQVRQSTRQDTEFRYLACMAAEIIKLT